MYNKNFQKEKWNMTLDVLDEKVWLQLFSQSTMGHVTSLPYHPHVTYYNLIHSGPETLVWLQTEAGV